MRLTKAKEYRSVEKDNFLESSPSFQVDKIQSTDGGASMAFTIVVPDGQSLELDISKVGQAIYMTAGFIQPGYTLITADLNTMITGTKKYILGILADEGDLAISTSIAITLDGSIYYTLVRAHADPPTTS